MIEFCYGHRLRNYNGLCKNIHGHNGKIEIECSRTQLDERGMVVDFVDVGKIVKGWVDRQLDHKLLLRKDDPLIAILKEHGEPVVSLEENPTAEHIAKMVFDFARSQNLPVTSVTLWETDHAAATYRAEEKIAARHPNINE